MNQKTKVIIGSAASLLILAYCYLVSNTWRSPGPYAWFAKQGKERLLEIVQHPHKHHVELTSMLTDFDVYFVNNMPEWSYNPYFPAIHIIPSDQCNGWLQVIRTDAKQALEHQCFVDTWPEGYPFYTQEKNFIDQPFWVYSLLDRPLHHWQAHAYAVHVDREQQTIQCLGGISWGYRLVWWWLRPIMIEPQALEQHDWQKDWLIFQEKLPGYKNI